jgi:hypothetical protein
MGENYRKRGEGKHKGDIKKYNFFSYYRKNAKLERLERKEYDAFLKALLTAYSEAIIKENMHLKMGKLGYLRIQSRKTHFFRKDGSLAKSLKVNWKKTWEHWEKKYEGKTRDEITEIKNKKVFYHENEHTNGEFYRYLWDNVTSIIKHKTFYTFKPSRTYTQLLSKTVSDPDRKVFYYG